MSYKTSPTALPNSALNVPAEHVSELHLSVDNGDKRGRLVRMYHTSHILQHHDSTSKDCRGQQYRYYRTKEQDRQELDCDYVFMGGDEGSEKQ